MSWNLLGVLLWVVIILYLVFIVQNIRRRRIKMIIKQHKWFTWMNFGIDLAEIVIFIVALVGMFNLCVWDNPDLEDNSRISANIKYEPLVMNTGTGNSSYVTVSSAKKKMGSQTYTYYRPGSKTTVSGNDASIVYGEHPSDVNAARIPYQKKKLKAMDQKYQRAYVAIYTARYKKNWQNGLGMHAGRLATKYYLIRVPDQSFIKQVK
ncbi:LVIS_2131 family protein [Lactobacillus xujianguonis]|uniref:LVIS_2131 family protein n=1 Tax=Lactobacillus xujianguonis TaxID=2495899 RepID=UPI000FD85132|nr:LVIS_2131 family protein [Lactobacillus xujianguonis]RVU73555.1 hypothetical protein EJK20_07510 [Lactobacillus xujianguonis]